MTSSPVQQHPAPPREPEGFWQRWTGPATVIGTVIAFAGLVVAILTYVFPLGSSDTKTQVTQPVTATVAATTGVPASVPAQPATATAAPAEYLSAAGIPIEAGQDKLIALPRAIAADASYASHPIVLHCPTNELAQSVTFVTWTLNRHYVQFDATVHPYYPPGADQRSVTYVSATAGTRQPDDSLVTKVTGKQLAASPSAPKTISASLDGADQLTVGVRCDDPDGYVVLTDARLTSA